MESVNHGVADAPQFVGLSFIRQHYGLSRHMLNRLIEMKLVRYVALPNSHKHLYRVADVDAALSSLETTGEVVK